MRLFIDESLSPKLAGWLNDTGRHDAVLVPIAEWRRLQAERRPGLKALLLTDEARAEIPVSPRGRRRTAGADIRPVRTLSGAAGRN